MGFTLARRWMGSDRGTTDTVGPPRAAHAHASGTDELRELTETFGKTVHRLDSLMREVESAHQRALQAEIDKKDFYREVICAVTQGRFALIDRADLPELGELVADLPCQEGPEYAAVRTALRELAESAGMSEERSGDLVLAAGEAITNSMKHATAGRCRLYKTVDALAVRVADSGAGIRTQDLPNVILTPGFSTKVSLGMGYTLMLQLVDRLWLSTDPEGTVVQMEKKIHAAPEPEAFPQWVLDRL